MTVIADFVGESAPTAEQLHQDAFNAAQYNAMGDGIISVDTAGTVLLSDRVSRVSLDIYPGSSLREQFPALWSKVVETMRDRRPRFELSVQRGEASFLVTVSPVMVDDEVSGAICVFVENTDLEIMTRQLRSFRELTKELAAIIDSSSEGLWVFDGYGVVLRINPAAERNNRVKKEVVVGLTARELIEQGYMERSPALEVLGSKGVVNMLVNEGNRKLIVTGTPVFGDEGGIIRVVVSERDITEIDKLQRELEDQEAIKGQFWHHMLEQQQAELASQTIIAKSPRMITALRQAVKVSSADSTVLIHGESGVGKGLFADLIHKNSSRSAKPIIKLNCGAIPESLIESELFGHERGAFTGAQTAKPGYLELADNGILFLDEIAELPLASQVKLLRFLEDGRVTRLGGTTGRTVDVRIIAATHRDLEKMVVEKTFRLDLYYRLNVIPLYIPALRERQECLLPLIRHYIDYFSQKVGKQKRLARAALDALLAYGYPGNVRELMNLCERLVVMSETEVIDLQDLPKQLFGSPEEKPLSQSEQTLPVWPVDMTLEQILESVERSLLSDAMKEHGNQYRIAEALGINQSTVARKLKKYGIS
ncbi:sigma 54-interacting transcriptional regulator [Geomonas azotofigens]|uniref:sigma 54-interacting transcriptional regulator n=1 Tax=Geomonas azotofigens TaxID=2843196 RepID=UPI001C11ECEB|nr:sigma 54-interacting transcriptional regulator [Geomonas azotofigens]MBU5612296.1 sigma 54-interacting transcriptional regulator [Geomonas azotofigens]